jgi:DNA-binding transcriptional LysR family regulator
LDTRITLRKLEIFELVVELESVSQAADKLWLAQPVVTSHVRSLEEKLGVTLFKRQARRMELTEAGAAVHVWSADVLRRTAEVSRDLEGLADGSRGSVAVSASISIGSYALPPMLSAFRRERPEVAVKLDVADYRKAIAEVESSACDFGVVAAPTNPSSRGIVSERIGSDAMVAVAAPDGEPESSTLTKAEFSRLPFIEIARHAAMDRELDRAGIRPREVTLDLGHPEAVKCAVREGIGVSVLFRTAVAAELEAGTLRTLEIEGVDLALDVYLVYREGKQFAPAHVDLMDRIRELFAAAPVAA